jgi:hypothetical protein
MEMAELFVPISAMAMFAVIIGLITRLIATGMHHKTLRQAMRDDPSSVPMLAERLDSRLPWADGLLGWIFIAFAVALILLGLTEGDLENRSEALRAAIVPAVIGVFVLAYVRFARKGTPAG